MKSPWRLDITDEEVIDNRDVHAAEEADLLGGGQFGSECASKVGAFVLLEGDGVDILEIASSVVDGGIIDNEVLLRVFWSDFLQHVNHLPGADDDDVPIAADFVFEGRLPFGLVEAHFNGLDLDFVAVFGSNSLHAAF